MKRTIGERLELPCGVVLQNRICKAAMTEGLADEQGRASERLAELYRVWGQGGAGLLITGNVQIDRHYVERSGNVTVQGPQSNEQLYLLSQVCKSGVAPSPIASKNLKGYRFLLPSFEPRELTAEEIAELPNRFAMAARVCKQAGFTGVQIHSAHGYLLSSFLNPLANQRSDEYGGSLSNRARPLLQIVAAVRAEVGPKFPISVKLNSSDFQKGGFSHMDAVEVARLLDAAGIDLLEVSGGNYENPVIMTGDTSSSTQVREAYFLVYARDIKAVLQRTPLMVTGGFRSRAVMDSALASKELDMIGVARPLCVMPDCVRRLVAGEIDRLPEPSPPLGGVLKQFQLGRIVEMALLQMWYYRCEILISEGNKAGTGFWFSWLGNAIWMELYERKCASALVGLECEGTVVNARSMQSQLVALLIGIVVAFFAHKLLM